jgi:hypothetical protein
VEAIRRIEQVHGNQLSFALPDFFRGKKVEVIILPFQEGTENVTNTLVQRRTPSPRLRGTIKMADDLIAPACATDEWDALK